MPCSDGRDFGGVVYRDNPEMKARLDAATRVACEGFKLLTPDQLAKLSPPAHQWWENHQAEDRRREAAEEHARQVAAAKKRALDKLTPGERKLLGVGYPQ